MKKVLLLCLTALMCCVTGAWAISGSGTQEDPYIVNAGDQLTISNTASDVYAEFTAPADGTLALQRQGWNNISMTLSEKDNPDNSVIGVLDFGSGLVNFDLDLESGKTYVIHAPKDALFGNSETYTVIFTEAGGGSDNPDAFTITEANPAEGSAIASVTKDNPIQITIDKPVAYLRARLDGKKYGYLSEIAATPDETTATPVLDEDGNQVIFVNRSNPEDTYPLMAYTKWTIAPDNESGWVMYDDDTYTLTLNSYYDLNGWYDMTPLATVTMTYTGATEGITYSDAHITSITPDPDATDESEIINFAEGRNQINITFSEAVNVTDVLVALGQGLGTVPAGDYSMNEDNTVLNVKLDNSFSNEYSIQLYVAVTDINGNPINDENGEFSRYFGNSSYTIQFDIADGRKADMSLEYDNLKPADGGYVTTLDSIRFTVSGGADGDGWYYATSKANAGIYNEAGEKVADVLLTVTPDEGSQPYTATAIAAVCELGSVNAETDEGTPTEITTPGTYTLRVDSLSIGDGNFDANYPWLMGNSGYGRCNPTWTWTFNVVDKMITVTGVDPMPFNVSGEYNEEIPAEITVTLSDADYAVTSALVTYGMNTREEVDCRRDGNNLIISLSDVQQSQSRLSITIRANAANGSPIVYGTEEDGDDVIALTYQLPINTFVPTEVTPADNSNVESLETITLTLPNEVGTLNPANSILLTDGQGQTVARGAIDYDPVDWTKVVIKLDSPVTADGTYTLTVPEQTFYDIEDNLYNPELTYTYYIGTGTGISSISTDADGNVKVYTVDGVYVGEGNAADMLGKLAKGIYIVNGTKVSIK